MWLKKFIACIFLVGCFVGCARVNSSELWRNAPQAPTSLRVGIGQIALGSTLEESRDRILQGISEAAMKDVRVVVFPEGALSGAGDDDQDRVDEAVAAIRQAAITSDIYVLMGGFTYSTEFKKNTNWMLAIGPEGKDLLKYEKIYDNHTAPMPGVFLIDSIPCSVIICADRWLRGVEEIPVQQGAKISFELSNNFAAEWVDELQWYWYVPRALRNTTWVVFANTANSTSKLTDNSVLHHGHSAMIAPNGSLATFSKDDKETLVIADLDVSQATRAEALARSGHPTLRAYWEAGKKLQAGQPVNAAPFTPLYAEEVEITIAVSQITSDLSLIEKMVQQAKSQHADLIAFPAQAVADDSAFAQIKEMAQQYEITIIMGMEYQSQDGLHNSAFVLGPDGSLLTRYDQLSAEGRFQPGTDPSSMWFQVKGVPAVVTVGRDALWTELSELPAIAGAQIHVHLDHDPDAHPEADLQRLQIGSNMASYGTFTAIANVFGSTIWDDLHGAEESRAETKGEPKPDTGPALIYSPYSANVDVRAKSDSLIMATRKIPGLNPYHPRKTSKLNPQMEDWYRIGVKAMLPKNDVE